MSDEIEVINGRASIAYSGNPPWHGMGQAHDGAMTREFLAENAGLGFEVEKQQVRLGDAAIPVPNWWAVVRTDKPTGENVLGLVKGKYVPIQTSELFDVMDKIVGESKAIYHAGGVLHNGRRVWILAKLPGEIEVTSQDRVAQYLAISNCHDGTEAARIFFTPIRIVCQNTLNIAVQTAGVKACVWHTGNTAWQFSNAAEILGIATKAFQTTGGCYSMMRDFGLTTSTAAEYFEKIIPDDPEKQATYKSKANVRAKMGELFETGKGNALDGTRGTLWAAYNAATEYVDHVKFAGRDPGKRLSYSWFVSGAKLRATAFRAAKEMVKAR